MSRAGEVMQQRLNQSLQERAEAHAAKATKAASPDERIAHNVCGMIIRDFLEIFSTMEKAEQQLRDEDEKKYQEGIKRAGSPEKRG